MSMQSQKDDLLTQARNYFQKTGFCAHHKDFRQISKWGGVTTEQCGVCAKQFKKEFSL